MLLHGPCRGGGYESDTHACSLPPALNGGVSRLLFFRWVALVTMLPSPRECTQASALTIAIPPIENRTARPGADRKHIRRIGRLLQELQTGSVARLVP